MGSEELLGEGLGEDDGVAEGEVIAELVLSSLLAKFCLFTMALGLNRLLPNCELGEAWALSDESSKN